MARTPARPEASKVKKLQRRVLEFYRTQRRDLPWRHTTDPYRILVSEIMLQQTQVDRVLPKYREFLARFPSLRSLARARFSSVLRVWLGLGYNARALRLWRCARAIVREHRGQIPNDPLTLQRLPGVGTYTAAALSSFAFGAQVPVIDTNVRRVLVRALTGRDRAPAARVTSLARQALPLTRSASWAQALMDLGARFCRSIPKCAQCPARSACAYARKDRPASACRVRVSGPTFHGSRRFYRGRIMRLVSAQNGVGIAALGRQVKENFGASDGAWLDGLLNGLSRDGLVLIDRRRGRIRLP